MGQEFIGGGVSQAAQMVNGLADIERVPIDDCGRDEVEAGRLEGLIVKRAVTHAALLVCKDCLGERMTRFTFVEPSLALLAELLGFEPVEGEEGPLDPAYFLKRKIEAVLAPVRAQLFEHH